MTLGELSALAAAHGVALSGDVVSRRRTTLPHARGAVRYTLTGGTSTGRDAVARAMARDAGRAVVARPHRNVTTVYVLTPVTH